MDTWNPIARVYHPLTAGSIDGTDTRPHDRAVERAIKASYIPPSADSDPHLTLFVARLNPETTEKTLHKTFSKYGDVRQVSLIRDVVTGFSKQYAFIEFEDERSARRARADADQSVIEEHIVFVDWECERTLEGWIPRRLGGGFGGKKESGQLRFGGRDRPFRKPIVVQARDGEDRDRGIGRERRERDRDRKKDRDRDRDRYRDSRDRERERRGSDRDREIGRDREKDRDRYREGRERDRERENEGNRGIDMDREDGEIMDREYDRHRGIGRDGGRDHRGKDRERDESRERIGDRYRTERRDKDRDKYRERERDRYRDSDKDRYRDSDKDRYRDSDKDRYRDRRKERDREREEEEKEKDERYRDELEGRDGREQDSENVSREASIDWDV